MADRYWVGGTGTWDTTTTTPWSATSGGVGGASVPTSVDSVFFNLAGSFTISCTGGLNCLDITTSTGSYNFQSGTSPSFSIYGSMTLAIGTQWTTTGGINFLSTTTGRTITTNGISLSSGVTFSGVGGGWTLGGAFSIPSQNMTIAAGAFDSNNFNISVSAFFVTGSTDRIVTFGTSIVDCSAIGAWTASGTNLTLNLRLSTINLSSSVSATFNGGGFTYGNVAFTYNGMSTQTINGNNTFNNLTLGPISSAGVRLVNINENQIVNGTFSGSGNSYTSRRQLFSGTLKTQYTITATTVATLQYIDFRDIAGAGATWSGTSLGDLKGNSGITFTPKTVYWNLAGAQNWSATGWASTSGGTPDVNNFPLAQDTCVFDNA